MKRVFLFLLIACVGLTAYCSSENQNTKFKTSSYSVRGFDKKTGWQEWSDPDDAEINIEYDAELGVIRVDSQVKQVYDVKVGPIKDGIATDFSLNCIDAEGNKCELVHSLTSGANGYQLIIKYEDFQVMYHMNAK